MELDSFRPLTVQQTPWKEHLVEVSPGKGDLIKFASKFQGVLISCRLIVVQQLLPLFNLLVVLLNEFILTLKLIFEIVILLDEQEFWFKGREAESILQEENVDLPGEIDKVHRRLLHL